MATFSGWTVIDMPSDPAPKSIEPSFNCTVGATTNPFTRKQQIQDWQANFSELKVSMPPMTPEGGEAWKAFLVACDGKTNVFALPSAITSLLPAGMAPNGYWRMKTNTANWSTNDGQIFGLAFELREALPSSDVTLVGGGGGITSPSGSAPIDPVNMAGTLNGAVGDYYRNYGPISYGGWMWAFTLTEDDSSGDADRKLGVYKSQDGANWFRQDLAHAPDEVTPSYHYWDGISSVVKILVVNNESSSPYTVTEASLIDFDMSTGLFGPPYGAIDLRVPPAGAISGAAASFIDHPYVFQLSNGTVRIVYSYYYLDTFVDHGGGNLNGDAQSQVYYQDHTGGAWGERQLFAGEVVDWNTYSYLVSAVQDGDVIHCITQPIVGRRSFSNAWNEATYVRINADGTFATQSIGPILSADGSNYFTVNTGIISGNNLLIPIVNSTNTMGVLVGTPKSNPTFSFVTVPAADASEVDGTQMYHMASKDVFAYWQFNTVTRNNAQIYISTSPDGGNTWSAPALALDLDAAPPTAVPGQDTLDINSISLGTRLDGNLGMIYTSWCAYYALLNG